MGKLKFDKDKVIELCNATLSKQSKIQLVGDQGIYLMSFDQPTPRTIVYAEGCDPEANEDDFYDAKVDAYGGDDGVDDVGTAESLLKIAHASHKWVEVTLTATRISISSDPRPKVDYSNLPASLRKYVK